MANKSTALDKIDELQKQIEQLRQQAVDELRQKLSEARKTVSALEEELAGLTGKPAVEGKTKRTRRPSINDEELKGHVLKIMAAEGKNGLNAKGLAQRVMQDPMRIRKFIKDNPKVLKRQGTGPGTKFFLP